MPLDTQREGWEPGEEPGDASQLGPRVRREGRGVQREGDPPQAALEAGQAGREWRRRIRIRTPVVVPQAVEVLGLRDAEVEGIRDPVSIGIESRAPLVHDPPVLGRGLGGRAAPHARPPEDPETPLGPVPEDRVRGPVRGPPVLHAGLLAVGVRGCVVVVDGLDVELPGHLLAHGEDRAGDGLAEPEAEVVHADAVEELPLEVGAVIALDDLRDLAPDLPVPIVHDVHASEDQERHDLELGEGGAGEEDQVGAMAWP